MSDTNWLARNRVLVILAVAAIVAGVLLRLWPVVADSDSEQKFVGQLERIASGFDLDFHISDPASIPRGTPLIFHFMPDSLDIFTVKAVSASRAEVVPLSRDVIR